MSTFSKSALAAAALPLVLAACQPNDLVRNEPASSQTNVVTYGQTGTSARVGASSYIVVLNEDAALANLLPDTDDDYDGKIARMRSLIAGRITPDMAQRASQIYATALKGFAVDLTEDEVAFLRRLPVVASVQPDRTVSVNLPQGQPVAQSTQETPWGITRVGGSANYSGTARAWVIDTGIDLDHRDLNVDRSNGRNFVNRGRSADDDNGHGTHVAGTIAARNNTIGVVGVAAGARVVPVKVLHAFGFGLNSWILAGIDYVATRAKPGDVVNMSLGGGPDEVQDNAILRAAAKGIRFCLAAGNDGADANNTSPARVNGANIFTISAIDNQDRFATFSNWGNPPVDYAAPGVNVKSTSMNGGYATLSGTSMATPHAAGVLLLTNGLARTSGNALGDPDGNADPIISR